MSSMPQRDEPGQWGGAQQGAPQGTMPGQQGYGGIPGQQGTYPGQQQGGPYGQQQQWASQPGSWSPVNIRETRVTGRRVVQYVIDYVLAGIIPGLAYWLFDRGEGALHGVGWFIATIIALAVYLWYWVLRPNSHDGQTFGMQLLRLRIISKDGGPANMTQMFVRAILLLVDTLFFGLVGLITMLCSRYRQRVGDHAARTLVIASGYEDPYGMPRGAGTSGYAGQGSYGGQAQPGAGPGGQAPYGDQQNMPAGSQWNQGSGPTTGGDQMSSYDTEIGPGPDNPPGGNR